MPATVGVSLKAYFGHARARAWLTEVAERIGGHAAVRSGAVEVFVVPTYPQIPAALDVLAGTRVRVGAQDVSAHGPGAFTGEVTADELAELGVSMVEVGHAERRRLFGETDAVVAAKTAAAVARGLTPVLCVGESEALAPEEAATAVVGQLRRDLAAASPGPVIVAYEPVWAIGAPEPASSAHVVVVAHALRGALAAMPERSGSSVIYGGAAGPGLVTRLGDAVDGVFLGRFAHDVTAFAAVVDEAAAREEARA